MKQRQNCTQNSVSQKTSTDQRSTYELRGRVFDYESTHNCFSFPIAMLINNDNDNPIVPVVYCECVLGERPSC